MVTEVQKNGTPRVRFYYDDRGHRIKKESILPSGTTTTYYVRDAAGSVMAIYQTNQLPTPGAPGYPTVYVPVTKLEEHPIYGSSRLGVHYRQSGTDAYQLTDHLGNVRAVIMKNGNNAVSLTAKTDYYPGGMAMPNRNVQGNYRYNYQGQELDKETGKHAFELRLYDSRINRWISPDPYGQYDSPYMAMGNDWINGIDPDGGCYIKNEDGSYSKCPEESVGSTRTGAFGYNWTSTKNDGWQVTNGASSDIETSYTPVLADGNADYYIKRYASHLERYNSKPPDYYLGYGHKYINRFKNKTRPKLSGAGKKWLDKTAVKLQEYMEVGLRESDGGIATNNKQFRDFAFATHPDAYVKSGLLYLGVKDKYQIGNTVDFNDLSTLNGIEQGLDVGGQQLMKWMFDFSMFSKGINFSKPKSDCGCSN